MTKSDLLKYIDSQTGNGSMGVLMIRNYVERNMLSGLAFRCPNCDELIFWKGEKHCNSCGCELEDEDYHEQNLKAYAHDFDCTIEEAEKALMVDRVNVIRCKDCAIRYDACPMVVRIGSNVDFFTDDEDYCSRGRRKGEEE